MLIDKEFVNMIITAVGTIATTLGSAIFALSRSKVIQRWFLLKITENERKLEGEHEEKTFQSALLNKLISDLKEDIEKKDLRAEAINIQCEQRVEKLEAKVESLNAEVISLTLRAERAESQVAGLQDRQDGNIQRISALESENKELKNRNNSER